LTLGISLFLVIPCKDNKKIVTHPLFVGKVEKKRKKADGYSLSALSLHWRNG
jgi:hypothetical protein